MTVDVMKTIDEEFQRKTNAPHNMEHEEIIHIDKVKDMNPECTGETTLIALAEHAAENAGASLDISALRQHRLAGTKLCDLADEIAISNDGTTIAITDDGLSAFLSPLLAVDDGPAIAEKVRAYLNAGVCKYLQGKRKAMSVHKRQRSLAAGMDAKRYCRDYVFDHLKQMAAAGGDANKISEGIIAANEAFDESSDTPGVRIEIN